MKYCLIGEKLSHSLSAFIHGEAGLDYKLVELGREEIAGFAKKREYDGFNVTIPYKKEIIKYLDEISADALGIGAVNTVKKVDNRLIGYNTDVFGMEYALMRAGISLAGKEVVILGGGGTGATAEYLAKKSGAKKITVVRRKGEINYSNVCDLRETQIIINCTPVGMFPDTEGCPVDIGGFGKLEGVFDCIYNPLKTKLIAAAEKAGVKSANGLIMLVAQGIRSEEIWTNKPADNGLIDRLIKETEEYLK